LKEIVHIWLLNLTVHLDEQGDLEHPEEGGDGRCVFFLRDIGGGKKREREEDVGVKLETVATEEV